MSIAAFIKTSKTGIYAILLFYVIAIVCRYRGFLSGIFPSKSMALSTRKYGT